MTLSPEQLAQLDLDKLSPEARAELEEIVHVDRETVLFRPLPGPQADAFYSDADVLGFGGAAGGGKSALGMGLAVTQHRRVGIFRQHATELHSLLDFTAELIGTRDGYSSRDSIWRATRTDGLPIQLEFGSFPNPGDELKQQGRARDLLVFDEAQNMREASVRYVCAWNRSTAPGQRCRVLMTFNPPTTVEGRWVVKFFAPWLDPKHPNPAKPGELRWFATVDGKDHEVQSGQPFTHDGETITPLSRTFIPSKVSDNPYLANSGYVAQLQSLPEPLRSQMLHGDFLAGVEDDPWQVIPTAWVEAAMARWIEKQGRVLRMDAVGVDVARGGRDSTIIARRHGKWFDQPLVYPGSATPNGQAVAGLVIAAVRDGADVNVDVIGVGSSPYDFLRDHLSGSVVRGVNVAEAAGGLDKSGRLQFRNKRSELWWRMREALDPANVDKTSVPPMQLDDPNAARYLAGIALPPDRRLLADLTAPTWRLVGQTIQVASREEILKRIGRSPDFGSAFVLALMGTSGRRQVAPTGDRDFDPYALRRLVPGHRGSDQAGFDPYAYTK